MMGSGMEVLTFIYRAVKRRRIGRVNEEIWTKMWKLVTLCGKLPIHAGGHERCWTD